jgi:hypothetical protein
MELSSEDRQTAKQYLISKRKSLEQWQKEVSLVENYLLSLLPLVDNMKKFQTNSDIHSINTRHKHDLHMLNANLTTYQKGAYYAGIKLFNTFPASILKI